jgi:branched-chain amino acid transport system permease protein
MLIQFLVNSFSLGSFYALTALGFSLIFGVTRAFNLAHGEMVVLGGYIAYVLGNHWHISFFWTIPFSMLFMVFVSVLLRILLVHVREPFQLNSLVLTFGLALLLQNLMLGLFSADYRLIRLGSAAFKIPLAGASITPIQASLISLSLLATGAVYLLWRKTFLGKALRATMQDSGAARLAGIHIGHMGLIAFALGGVLIGLAGPLYGITAFLHPFGGTEPTMVAIIITIFAGTGRIRGILAGGWILGLVESAAVYTIGASWRECVSATILIGLLLLRPEGIFPQWTAAKK